MYRRKGISSILGTLIFIGILFSSVMPMFLMMRQADVYYEQRKLEVNKLDEEKALEDLAVYVTPSSSTFTITLINNGDIATKAIRVWENGNNHSIEETILTQNTTTLDPIDFSDTPEVNDTYDIRVTTERGNSFVNKNGIMTYGSEGWEVEKFYINIHAGGLFLHVKVTNSSTGEVFFDRWDTVGAGYEVEVPSGGTYHVLIEEKIFWWTNTKFDDDVTINWPPETSVDVYP